MKQVLTLSKLDFALIALFCMAMGLAADLSGQMSTGSYDLEGAVKRMTIAQYNCNEDGSPDLDREYYTDELYEFNKLGFLVKYDERSNKLTHVKQTREIYFQHDSLRVKEDQFANERLTQRYEFIYDALGNEIVQTHKEINSEDTLCTKMLSLYNEQHKAVEFQHFTNGSMTGSTFIRLDAKGNDVAIEFHNAKSLESSINYALDEHGNRTTSTSLDAKGNVLRKIQFEYDEAGNVTKEIIYTADEELDEVTTYQYHPEGTLAAKLGNTFPGWIKGDGGPEGLFDEVFRGERKASFYNQYYDAHGNITQLETNNVGPIQTKSWEYTYDIHGSWITKKYISNGQAIDIEIRTIEYY